MVRVALFPLLIVQVPPLTATVHEARTWLPMTFRVDVLLITTLASQS